MNRNRLSFALATACLAATPVAHAGVDLGTIAGSETSFEGMIQTDGYWYDSDIANLDADAGDGSDTDFGLRRAELVLKGKGPGGFDWTVAYDASGDGKFLDAFGRYRFGGRLAPYLQVGQFKQPIGLEELSSSKNNDFIAKALVTNTFAVSRRLGIGSGIGGDDWGLAASLFTRELTRDRAHGGGYGLRGWWAPVNGDGNVLHLGVSRVDHDTDADTLRLRARPGADMANRLVDTGSLTDTDRVATTGFEALWMRGPLKLQGEYMRSRVSRVGGAGDFTGTGGYASALWNLTGESWGYKGGTPSTPTAAEPHKGLWQLGVRYDRLDLDDGTTLGGTLDTLTTGVNWYWREHFKVALNYVDVSSDRGGVADDPSIIEARVQLHW
jgi:phosphate-selective porin OprO/OprP